MVQIVRKVALANSLNGKATRFENFIRDHFSKKRNPDIIVTAEGRHGEGIVLVFSQRAGGRLTDINIREIRECIDALTRKYEITPRTYIEGPPDHRVRWLIAAA